MHNGRCIKDCTNPHKDLAALRHTSTVLPPNTTNNQTLNTDSVEAEINQTYVTRLPLAPSVGGVGWRDRHEECGTTYWSSLVLSNLSADRRNVNGRNIQNKFAVCE